MIFTGASIPCTRSTEQWAAGLGQLATSFFNISDPCAQSGGLAQTGPGQQSYTTAPFKQPTTIAGPIGATLYATATTKDTEWVVTVSDVAPNGSATPADLRAARGRPARPGQLDELDIDRRQADAPVPPVHAGRRAAGGAGKVTRYDIEVFPTFDTLAPGHSLRITVATSDFPHVLPSAAQLPNLLGGIYAVEHSSAYPSSVEIPLSSPDAFAPVASGPHGCPAATGRLRGLCARPRPARHDPSAGAPAILRALDHGRRYMDFFCLSPTGIRVGYASPKLRSSVSRATWRRIRGRSFWRSPRIATTRCTASGRARSCRAGWPGSSMPARA